MPSDRNIKYANNEISLAKAYLSMDPNDNDQKDRLAWWSAYLGDIETAKENAVSEKVKKYIQKCETR